MNACACVYIYAYICVCVYIVLYSVFLCRGNSIFQHVIMYYMYSLLYTGIVFSSQVESVINVIGPIMGGCIYTPLGDSVIWCLLLCVEGW